MAEPGRLTFFSDFTFASTFSKSENLSLAYVDVDIIINNSNAGKKFFNEINQSIQKKKEGIWSNREWFKI